MKALSLTTLITTFLLLLWGGVVHNTGSGLACPDWPLCYGEFLPPMKGGIFIEHGHRLLASLVGLLTIALLLVGRNREEWRKPTRLALAFVIIQGLLGGITVLYRLPTIVSTTHLGLAMVFFCTIILICHRCLASSSGNIPGRLRGELILLGLLLYGQILLGAFMRHSGAGASCGLGPQASLLCRDIAQWGEYWWPPSPAGRLHMFHRYLGVALALALIWRIPLFLRHKPLRWPALALLGALLGQIALGLAVLFTSKGVLSTTAHLGLAALCLGLLWWLYLESCRLSDPAPGVLEDWFQLTRPKLTALVLGTVLVGLIAAPVKAEFFQALFILASVWGVSAGAVLLNGYGEREVDKLMERTADRPLPAGRISPRAALWAGVFVSVLSLIALALAANILTATGALAAELIYLFAYTPLKRRSPLALPVGAVAGAIPPVLGWTALTGKIDAGAWSLFAILFAWQIPHFLAISLRYGADYERAGIAVYPNRWSSRKTRGVMILTTFALIGCSLLGATSTPYLCSALGLGAGLLAVAVGAGAREYFWGSIFYLPLLLGARLFLV